MVAQGNGGAGGGGGGQKSDPSLSPLNEKERAAIKELLQNLREKKDETGAGNSTRFVSASPSKAAITVSLPEDAKLYVDGVACPLKSARRSFNTPALQTGREYYYTLRAEVTRNGRPFTQSQQVVVSAGRRVNVEFKNLTPLQTTAQR